MEWRVKVNDGSNILAAIPAQSIHSNTLDVIYSRIRSNITDLLEGSFDKSQVPENAFKSLKRLSELVRDDGKTPNTVQIWVKKEPIRLNRNIAQLIQEDCKPNYNDYGTIEGVLQTIQDGKPLTIKVRDVLYKDPMLSKRKLAF